MSEALKDACEQSYRVALFRSLQYNWVTVMEMPKSGKPLDDYVQVSDTVEVRFQPLSNNEVVRNAVASLEAAERQAFDICNRKVAQIREQKKQLLALTHRPESRS